MSKIKFKMAVFKSISFAYIVTKIRKLLKITKHRQEKNDIIMYYNKEFKCISKNTSNDFFKREHTFPLYFLLSNSKNYSYFRS